ncbi:hypothetical protein U0070_015116 [Myodes glareolus]|uniref:Uncharacterized protein n=1 Tax=Myodes glareolus TaxID=447135 RepID=A0AAW0H3Q3_MYOGA
MTVVLRAFHSFTMPYVARPSCQFNKILPLVYSKQLDAGGQRLPKLGVTSEAEPWPRVQLLTVKD